MPLTFALTDTEATQVSRLLAQHIPANRRHRFAAAEPVATRSETDALRTALATCTDGELARLVRGYFNDRRTEGEPIWSVHVRAAVRLLGASR